MIKKILLTSALSLFMLAGHAAPSAEQASAETQPAIENVAAASEEVEGDWVNSTEVNTVQESAVAKRMTQAEKAENARVNDSFGGAITIIAMSIVVMALVVLSVLFFLFGKISTSLQSKKKLAAHGLTKDTAAEEHQDVDSGEVIAAIALALSQHFDSGHDMEDTILTLRRIRRAYSPWNSKIYNMRHTLEPHKAQ